jgi:hypothetical protein
MIKYDMIFLFLSKAPDYQLNDPPSPTMALGVLSIQRALRMMKGFTIKCDVLFPTLSKAPDYQLNDPPSPPMALGVLSIQRALRMMKGFTIKSDVLFPTLSKAPDYQLNDPPSPPITFKGPSIIIRMQALRPMGRRDMTANAQLSAPYETLEGAL